MDAFRIHFEKFCGLLRKRGLRPDEAEDLVQGGYVRLLSYIDKGETVAEPEAFLARTVLNLSVDRTRRERTHLYEGRGVEEMKLADQTPGPEDELASEQYVHRTKRTLDAAVGEKTRSAFFMPLPGRHDVRRGGCAAQH